MNSLRAALILLAVLVMAGILIWSLRARITDSLSTVIARVRRARPARRPGHAVRGKLSAQGPHLARHDALARDFASRVDRIEMTPLGPDLSVVDKPDEEPALRSPAYAPPMAEPSECPEPEREVPESTDPAPVEPVPQIPVPSEPDADPREIDFCATVPGDDVLSRDQALSIYRQHEFELEKPHRIFARRSSSGEWCDLEQEPETGTYRDIALTIQLADRDGAVSQSDLTRFSSLVLKMADGFGRRLQFSSSVEDALRQAADLETLCREYDLLAVLNILSPEQAPFAGPHIDHCARNFDMELGHLNVYRRRNPGSRGGPGLYELANLYQPGFFDPETLGELSTKGLTLFMRLTSTWQPAEAIVDMLETAHGIAQCLGGELVDQNHRPLDARGIEQICNEVTLYVDALASEGIAPGGRVAARLFVDGRG